MTDVRQWQWQDFTGDLTCVRWKLIQVLSPTGPFSFDPGSHVTAACSPILTLFAIQECSILFPACSWHLILVQPRIEAILPCPCNDVASSLAVGSCFRHHFHKSWCTKREALQDRHLQRWEQRKPAPADPKKLQW